MCRCRRPGHAGNVTAGTEDHGGVGPTCCRGGDDPSARGEQDQGRPGDRYEMVGPQFTHTGRDWTASHQLWPLITDCRGRVMARTGTARSRPNYGTTRTAVAPRRSPRQAARPSGAEPAIEASEAIEPR